MSRGESYGGGQSSLGYLFGSDEQPSAPMATKIVNLPPYGIDSTTDKATDNTSCVKQSPSNNYQRGKGYSLGNHLTDRPSTRVKSAPGGDSSLGYLFGDK
ncbi:hypothetical protein CFOL_v3_19596 [Cephalotus follicularis]|uniref:Uncharacterized protein n=1 Tax=Cephalotus follicularis TaxID=3775 RepID=A0A1Q3C7P6_CEPFO|nr:hypothetical protein CFOL_v3_19596 [Cephalotus follicularis]